MIPPRRLVLSGGGIKVISIVGALKVLEEKKCLRSLREVSGVSAGAWLGFMIAGGLSIGSIEKMVLDLDFGVIRNLTPDAFLGLLGLGLSMGQWLCVPMILFGLYLMRRHAYSKSS